MDFETMEREAQELRAQIAVITAKIDQLHGEAVQIGNRAADISEILAELRTRQNVSGKYADLYKKFTHREAGK